MLQQTHLGRPKLIGLAGCQIKSFEVAVHFILAAASSWQHNLLIRASKKELLTGIIKTTDAVTLTYDPWGRARLDDGVGELEWMVQNQCSPSAGVPET